jgi:hypothetical protein
MNTLLEASSLEVFLFVQDDLLPLAGSIQPSNLASHKQEASFSQAILTGDFTSQDDADICSGFHDQLAR